MQWPGFSIVLPIKVFSRFVAMSEVDFRCMHAWGKQTREMEIALSTLFFFYKNIVFQGQAEYSYFSPDFRL